MGHNQSSEDPGAQTHTVRIDRSDVDVAFDKVYVSESVVDRVGAAQDKQPNIDPKIMETLTRKQEENEKLKEEIAKMREQSAKRGQQEGRMGLGAPGGGTNYAAKRQEEEERRKIFKDSVDRVSETFFNRSTNQSACAAQEQLVHKCYAENTKQPLRCSDLSKKFQFCVDEYRRELMAKNG